MAGRARWQAGGTTAVVLVGLVGLVAAGAVGASLLFAQVPEPEPEPATVTCWDGEERADADDCGQPTGVRGLRWVFPSFRPGDQDCRNVRDDHPDFQGPTIWACFVEIAGSPVRVTYSELTEVAESIAYLEKSHRGVERTTVRSRDGSAVRYEWRRRFEGGYVLISVYAEHPYAVEVRAEDAVLREDALETVVRFRPPGAISYR